MFSQDVSFSVVQDAHDNWPVKYTLPWPALAGRLADHRLGDKDGSALICGTFSGTRSSKTLLERWLVALDVEENKLTGEVPPDPESVAHLLMAKGLAGVLWTTWSSTPATPRYRIVLPLDKPIRPLQVSRPIDRLYSALAAANLRLNGVVDKGKFGAASLMFLARHPPGGSFFSRVVEGVALDAADIGAVAHMVNEKDAMREAQREALKATTQFAPEVRAKIDRYNGLHEIGDLLSQYGYRRGGDRFKSRYQHPSSQPATAIFPGDEMWCTFSQSDIDAGLGTKSQDGDSAFGDAFALYLHYEHGGNFRTALSAIELPEDWKAEHGAEQGSA
jgi:hypothetical protein